MLSANVDERRAVEALAVGTIEIVLYRRISEIRLFANGRRDFTGPFLGPTVWSSHNVLLWGILCSLNELSERRLLEIWEALISVYNEWEALSSRLARQPCNLPCQLLEVSRANHRQYASVVYTVTYQECELVYPYQLCQLKQMRDIEKLKIGVFERNVGKGGWFNKTSSVCAAIKSEI